MIRTWTPESETQTPPGTDYRTVKAWFQQCRDLANEIDNIQLEVQRLRDNATRCTANMSGMPGGSGYGDKIATYAEKADSEERRKNELEAELHDLREEAICRIRHIKGTKSSQMMQASMYGYYVCNKLQTEVANNLCLPSENRVSLYIKWAAIYLAEIWPELEKSA